MGCHRRWPHPRQRFRAHRRQSLVPATDSQALACGPSATTPDGKLWLSTTSGISSLDTEGSICNYGTPDGVVGGDFYGAAVTSSPDGRISFGSHSVHIPPLTPKSSNPTVRLPPPSFQVSPSMEPIQKTATSKSIRRVRP